MGILGSLLYPDNAKMAKELNDKEEQLRELNNLHNDLVNSYHAVGQQVKTFDAYLMSLMAMHYHLAYSEQDLSDLPKSDIPALSQSWADNIETGAMDILTVKMAVDGFKAIRTGVSNLCREGGIFSRTAPVGEDALAEGMGGEIEMVSLQTPLIRSSSVDMLTTEETSNLSEMSSELSSLAGDVSEVAESAGESGEASEAVSEASETAETATGAAEAGTEAAEAGEAGAAGFSAVLGPALLVVVAVTEVISAIHAGQTHDKLKEAEKKMDGLITKSQDGVTSIKKVYTHLLKAAKADIAAYNKLLPDLYAITHEAALKRLPFSVGGITTFITEMDNITAQNNGAQGYQAGASENLNEALIFIRNHATGDAQMTEVIKQIKTHMQKENLTDVADSDPYLNAVAVANSIALATVVAYNQFRRDIAEYGSVLLPYHEKIQQDGKSASGVVTPPKTVTPGKANPGFVPKPHQFVIPTIGGSH